MIVLLFLAQVGIVLTQFSQPDLVKASVPTFGVTTLGLITLIARLWRDRDRTATIIVVAESLDPLALRAVLDAMLQAQYGRRRAASGGLAATPQDKGKDK